MSVTTSKQNKGNTLDDIISELGDFGCYQILIFILLSFAMSMYTMSHYGFVFTAKTFNYRCYIPECDNTNFGEVSNDYNPVWLINVLPHTNNKPANCLRFSLSNQNASNDFICYMPNAFNHDELVLCKNGYVYDTDKTSIVNDFDIHCDENRWKLTLVGTIYTFGQFVGLPIAGIFSDRYGRQTLLVLGLILGGICGIIKSFATSYIMFVLCEFTDAFVTAGLYSCMFILAVELVSPPKRVLAGTIVTGCGCLGEICLALLAWWITSWRTLLRVVYMPLFLFLIYKWIIPESVRWLLSKNRTTEAKSILQRVAAFNHKTLTESALDQLNQEQIAQPQTESFHALLKSKTLLWRFINCCFCWISCSFIFYGITLNSVDIAAGNSYVNFMLTSLVQIPAYLVINFLVDRIGRTKTQCLAFVITGVSSIILIFVDDQMYYLHLCFYLIGKFGATAAFSIIYIITSEVFPTPMRHSVMGTCSMIGRIGSMVSPQVPLISQIWTPLPLVLYGIISTIAGWLSMLFPETLNTILPDSIEEAENIGVHV